MQLKEKTWYQRRDGKKVYCVGFDKNSSLEKKWVVAGAGSYWRYNFDGSYIDSFNLNEVDITREIGPTLEEKPKEVIDKEKVWELYKGRFIAMTNEAEFAVEVDNCINAYKAFAKKFK